MCFGAEAAWIPAVIAALGTGTSMVAQDQARKKQDQQAARGIQQQAEIQRQAGEKVSKNIEDIRASNPEDEKRAAEQDFFGALKKREASQGAGATDALAPLAGGAGSARFAQGTAQAKQQNAGDVAGMVKNLAAIDAPSFQRINENQGQGNLASELSLLGQQSQGQDFLTKMRVGSVHANPWLMAAGEGLNAYGQAAATNPRYGKKPPYTVPGDIQVPDVLNLPGVG